MPYRFDIIGHQYKDFETFEPLAYGIVHFYKTNTRIHTPTYKDNLLTLQNPNPIILDENGYFPNGAWLSNRLYNVVVENADGVQQFTDDPEDGLSIIPHHWNDAAFYSEGDKVKDPLNLRWYISLFDDNTGNIPSIASFAWTEFLEPKSFNDLETYDVRDIATYTDFFMYSSLTSANIDNIPPDKPINWDAVAAVASALGAGVGGIVELTSNEDVTLPITITGLPFEPAIVYIVGMFDNSTGAVVSVGSAVSSAVGSCIKSDFVTLSITSYPTLLWNLDPGLNFREGSSGTLKEMTSDGFILESTSVFYEPATPYLYYLAVPPTA